VPRVAASTRMSFFAAALAAAALDFASSDSALRPVDERRKYMANAIRFGENVEGTYDKLKWAEMALREYSDNGPSIAGQIRSRFEHDLNQVPAEDFAEIVVKLSNTGSLFEVARTLEYAAYRVDDVSSDTLPTEARSFVGALLDFSKQDRKLFAAASPQGTWTPSSLDKGVDDEGHSEIIEADDQGNLKL